MGLALSSPAFSPGGEIPALFTCEGRDLSPALEWTGVPEAAKSLVLIVDDPDAPDPNAPKMTWVHWVLYNLPPTTRGLPEAIAPKDLPADRAKILFDAFAKALEQPEVVKRYEENQYLRTFTPGDAVAAEYDQRLAVMKPIAESLKKQP